MFVVAELLVQWRLCGRASSPQNDFTHYHGFAINYQAQKLFFISSFPQNEVLIIQSRNKVIETVDCNLMILQLFRGPENNVPCVTGLFCPE